MTEQRPPSPPPSVTKDHAEGILDAVAHAAATLSAAARWEDAAPRVLESLGLASGLGRAYVYQNITDDHGRLCMDETFEWVAPGISTTIEDPTNHRWPYEDGYPEYVTTLSAGGVVEIHASTMTEAERKDVEKEGIRSAALVPIFAGEDWWGYLGFDDCTTEREWSSIEIQALRTAAATLGAAVLRQELEQRLADADVRFRNLVESISAVLYIDIPGEAMESAYVGPQLEPMLGITPDEWLGSGDAWQENLHPDDRERAISEWRNAMENCGTMTQEYRMVRPDTGAVVWIRDDSAVVCDENGDPTLIRGVMFGITAQKDAETQLVAAQQQFKTVVEGLPAVVYLDPVDENLDSIYVSPQIESILGVSPEEWLNNPSIWRELLHPDDVDTAWATYEEHRDSGEQLQSEYRMVRPDGRMVWIREEATILPDENGAPSLVLGLIHDITLRKKAEEQLHLQATLVESISDAVIAYDTDMTVTSWNRAAQVLYGWTGDDVMGRPLPEALRSDPNDPGFSTIWDPFVEELRGWRGRVTQQDKDGYEIPVETKVLPLKGQDGAITGYVMVNREIADN